MIAIIYGLPSLELMKQVEDGKLALGGCCIGENDPEWLCKECGQDWGMVKVG